MKFKLTIIICLIALYLPLTATAETSAEFIHYPPATWSAGNQLEISARVDKDWTAEKIWVAVRQRGASESFQTFPMKRTNENMFTALIPRQIVQPAGLEYYIASKNKQGTKTTQFASTKDPQPILVSGETKETHVRERLKRHDGNRSTFRLRGEATLFGSSVVEADRIGVSSADDTVKTEAQSDRYWITSLEYRYRILRTLYDIRFGLSMMRGDLPTVATGGGSRAKAVEADNPTSPGLNWGYGEATLELHRNFSVAPKVLLGASAKGFAPGIGGLIRIGQIGGTRLELGVESISDVGTTGSMSFKWDTVPRFPMGLTVELTDWPANSSAMATRLMYDLRYRATSHFQVGLRAGYAARTNGVEAGYLGGLSTSCSF
jgi:hypothetical protein